MGDRSGGGKQGSTARSTTRIGGRRGGNGGGSVGAEAEGYSAHNMETPREAFGALDMAKMDSPEETDDKSKTAVMK